MAICKQYGGQLLVYAKPHVDIFMLQNGGGRGPYQLVIAKWPVRVSYRRFQNSVGAGTNYNNQFLYISAIAFNKTHIYIMEDVLGIQGYIFQQV
jgi:hypothetical protein